MTCITDAGHLAFQGHLCAGGASQLVREHLCAGGTSQIVKTVTHYFVATACCCPIKLESKTFTLIKVSSIYL